MFFACSYGLWCRYLFSGTVVWVFVSTKVSFSSIDYGGFRRWKGETFFKHMQKPYYGIINLKWKKSLKWKKAVLLLLLKETAEILLKENDEFVNLWRRKTYFKSLRASVSSIMELPKDLFYRDSKSWLRLIFFFPWCVLLFSASIFNEKIWRKKKETNAYRCILHVTKM